MTPVPGTASCGLLAQVVDFTPPSATATNASHATNADSGQNGCP